MSNCYKPYPGEILRAVVGSTAHGLALAGSDDMDHMGVCIEPFEAAMGLGVPFEQHIYRTATERTGKHDAKSLPGDLDLTVFSLRKFLRLALKGNPTVLVPLFARGPAIVHIDATGRALQDLAPRIVSKKAIAAFLGYLTAQKERLVGERGQKRVTRPELVEKYGYDTKYAMHALRLGCQGVELASTGKLELPMPRRDRELCMAVRRGEIPLPNVVREIQVLELILKGMWEGKTETVLPDEPDTMLVEDWMLQAYRIEWDMGSCEP